MERMRPYYIFFGLFLAALCVRAAFLPLNAFQDANFVPPENHRFDGYYEIANNLVAGHGFTRSAVEPFVPDSVRTPGYPLIIAVLLAAFGSYKALFILQVVVGSLTPLMALLLAQEMLGKGRVPILIGIAVALEPLGAYLAGTIFTETLFTPLFLYILWLILRYFKDSQLKLWLLAAFLLGIATLIKPTVQFLPLIAIAFLWWAQGRTFSKEFFVRSGAFLAIFLLVLAPWLYRNYVVFSNASLAVQPVSNLFAYLVPSTIALEKGLTYTQAADEFFVQEHAGGIEDVNLGNAARFKEAALRELFKHPKGLVMSLGVTGYAFFLNDDYSMIVQNYFGYLPHALSSLATPAGSLILLGKAFWLAVTLLMFAGIYLLWKKGLLRTEHVLLLTVVAYFAATTAVIGLAINGRFRLPVDAIIFTFAAYALVELYTSLRSRWR